jgi:antitoxin (DNA-binding transcriptional repressor) of toxin-antitoxin stability system
MITVSMHDAKTRLSELVKAVEERNETVVLCRDGREVAEIRVGSSGGRCAISGRPRAFEWSWHPAISRPNR